MKILHINTYDITGGAEKIAFTLLKNNNSSYLLVKKKYSTHTRVLEFRKNILDKLILFINKVIWKFGLKNGIKTYFHSDDQMNYTYQKLRDLNEYTEADIIHLHNIHGGYFDLISLEKIAKEKYIVWTLHDMWAITGGEANTFKKQIESGQITDKELLKVYPLNNPLIDRRKYWLSLKINLYKKIKEKITFVPVSKWLETEFKSLKIKNSNVKTIYNGIDTQLFFPVIQKKWEKTRIIFFNNKNPFKGADVFIKALPIINVPIDLHIVGDKLDIKLPQHITPIYLNSVTNEEEMSMIFQNANGLIFPSKAESFGLLAAEAMACGLCVLASNVGGIPEIIENKINGFLFENNNYLDLAAKANEVWPNIELMRNVGENASKTIREKFPVNNMIEKYKQLYIEILNSNLDIEN